MFSFYINRSFVDTVPGIELVNIHYTWTLLGGLALQGIALLWAAEVRAAAAVGGALAAVGTARATMSRPRATPRIADANVRSSFFIWAASDSTIDWKPDSNAGASSSGAAASPSKPTAGEAERRSMSPSTSAPSAPSSWDCPKNPKELIFTCRSSR